MLPKFKPPDKQPIPYTVIVVVSAAVLAIAIPIIWDYPGKVNLHLSPGDWQLSVERDRSNLAK